MAEKPKKSADILLKGSWLLPVTAEPVASGTIAVAGDSILGFGTFDEMRVAHLEAPVKDLGDSILMPGFVNVHHHTEYTVYRGMLDDVSFKDWIVSVRQMNAGRSESDLDSSAALGVLEALSSGVTTLADFSRTGTSLKHIVGAGMRGFVFREVFGMDDRLTESIAQKAFDAYRQSSDEAGEMVKVGLSPHAPYTVSAKLFKRLAEWAREEGVKLAIHLSESVDEVEFIKHGSGPLGPEFWEGVGWNDIIWQPTGVTPVRYLANWDVFSADVLAVHCVILTEKDFELLQRYDVAVAHCPKSNAKLGNGIAPVKEMMECGLRIGLGTDSAASSTTMDFFDEMRHGILLHRGATRSVDKLRARDFIEMGTIGGARALGIEEMTGSIEAGKKADIIAIDLTHSQLNPFTDPYSALVYGANQDDVSFTMVGGKTLYEGYRATSLDEERIREEARRVRDGIVGS